MIFRFLNQFQFYSENVSFDLIEACFFDIVLLPRHLISFELNYNNNWSCNFDHNRTGNYNNIRTGIFNNNWIFNFNNWSRFYDHNWCCNCNYNLSILYTHNRSNNYTSCSNFSVNDTSHYLFIAIILSFITLPFFFISFQVWKL